MLSEFGSRSWTFNNECGEMNYIARSEEQRKQRFRHVTNDHNVDISYSRIKRVNVTGQCSPSWKTVGLFRNTAMWQYGMNSNAIVVIGGQFHMYENETDFGLTFAVCSNACSLNLRSIRDSSTFKVSLFGQRSTLSTSGVRRSSLGYEP